jgi:primosomal protein N' (replication factor Y)
MEQTFFIKVSVFSAARQHFWYTYTGTDTLTVGSLVTIPLQQRESLGCVIEIQSTKPVIKGTLRSIKAIEQLPPDRSFFDFVKKLAHYYQLDVDYILSRFATIIQESKKREPSRSEKNDAHAVQSPVILTDEQQTIFDSIAIPLRNKSHFPAVIHGITGSGKTEVYKKLIAESVAMRRSVVLLLPEVTLALEFEKKLAAAFGSTISIYSFHCASSPRERSALWHALCAQEPLLIIGVHLPIFLPIANLGCIIVDEEHDTGYQEKKHPKINSKEAALFKAHAAQVPIVLGSATPSISTLFNVKNRGWHFFQITKRFAGSLATVKTVLLPRDGKRSQFWISTILEKAIRDRLVKKEQTILFINRRGFSFFLQCTQCSFVIHCKRCSVSLTVHEMENLICHYCGYTQKEPSCCPSCKAASTQFIRKGIGTQQLVTVVKKLFPFARVARADLDTLAQKKKGQTVIADFAAGNFDILVGTQTVTKGYDFKDVTLVGAIWADINLHFPQFNASETTLQQLIQVSGRAGRFAKESEVIIQVMTDHPIFNYISEINYPAFYQYAQQGRSELLYPPYGRLVELELKHRNEKTVERDAQACADILQLGAQKANLAVQILGPARPPVHQVKRVHLQKIYVKASNMNDTLQLYQLLRSCYRGASSLFFTPNPIN